MKRTLTQWNEHFNGLPRKLALVAITFALAALLMWMLPYAWPFAVAYLLSKLLEPFVRIVSKGFLFLPERRRRSLCILLGMFLLFGLAGALLSAVISWLWREASGFVRSIPQLLEWFNTLVLPELLQLYHRFSILLPNEFPALLEKSLTALGQNALRLAASLSAWLTGGAWNTAASIPQVLLSLVLTVMTTYYLTADRSMITAYLRRTFPVSILKRSRLIRASLFKALMGQLRSQLTVSLVVMFFLMISLGISGVRYGVIIGLLIGAADALPLFGAGIFLISWSLISFLLGQNGLGITLVCLYAGTVIIRQILEPKLVGRQLGLYPPVAMGAMYVGFRLLGLTGLIAGPVLLTLAKAVLDADSHATQKQT